MTNIIAGMSPTEFNTAINGNIASLEFIGRIPTFDTEIVGHEIQTACILAGLGKINYGVSGKNFIDQVNAAFSAVSLADKVIAGAVDIKTFGAVGNWTTDDTAYIQTAINAGNIIIQNGTFKISASIKIPSNRTVWLFNCKPKKANSSFDNIFTNSDFVGGNVNINIIGLGGVEFDGNCANNNNDYATNKVLYPGCPTPFAETTYKNPGLFFCNVDGLEIKNIYAGYIPHWFACMQKCVNWSIHDIYINLDTVVRNQDGINLSGGCNNFEVYNITAKLGDDFSALCVTKYMGFGYVGGVDEWNTGDIHDGIYHDVVINSDPLGSMFISIIGDGRKIYNIEFRDILIKKAFSIMYDGYPTYHSTGCAKTDFKDLIFKNIKIKELTYNIASVAGCVFYFNDNMMNLNAENVSLTSGTSKIYALQAGDQSDNVKINGVQVS